MGSFNDPKEDEEQDCSKLDSEKVLEPAKKETIPETKPQPVGLKPAPLELPVVEEIKLDDREPFSMDFNRFILFQQRCLDKASKRFECNYCSNVFSSRNELKFHLKIHSGEIVLKCDCKSKVYKMSNLKYRVHKSRTQ